MFPHCKSGITINIIFTNLPFLQLFYCHITILKHFQMCIRDSSYSIGELKGCITEFLLEMKNQLALGNIVLLGDMGSFRVTIATGNATETAEKFKAATCIKTSRVRFRPGNMLLDMLSLIHI